MPWTAVWRGQSMSPANCRAGPGTVSILWSISPLTYSCRPMPSPTAAVPLGALIVVAGALYFADRRMKTSDNYFRGFPVLWNVAAFYLFLIKPAPWIAAIGIILLVALTFVPFHFIHPVRVRRWRVANVSLMVIWSGLAAWTVAKALDPPAWITLGLCGIAIYFIAAGLLRSAEGNGMPDA